MNTTQTRPEGPKSVSNTSQFNKPELPEHPNEDNNDTMLNDRTTGRMLGEIVWLMSQSPAHKYFSLADLEWMVMPALALSQYRIFRNGEQPLGVALWAYVSEDVDKKLQSGAGKLAPQEWAQGIHIDPEHGMVSGEGGILWLVDLICPAATQENKLADICLHDLMQTVFKGKRFKLHHVNPQTKQREVIELVG